MQIKRPRNAKLLRRNSLNAICKWGARTIETEIA